MHRLRSAIFLFAACCVSGVAADDQMSPSTYAGPNGHVMVVIPDGEFLMGSPVTESGRSDDETQHRVRIPRTFSLATTEVTNEQYSRFLTAVPDYAAVWNAETARFGNPPRYAEYSRTPDSPQVAVSWYDAARYCNWLSEQAGIPKQQWVYPDAITPDHGIVLPPDYLHRVGYRLPTEAEWEYAARAGTGTSRHFGDDDAVLPKYVWFEGNTNRSRAYPVSQLLPNQWGLFDMLGNVWEWTFDVRRPYPSADTTTEDTEDLASLQISNDVARTRRGGSFSYESSTARSAHRGDLTYFPNQTRDNVGFRVARTVEYVLQLPPASVRH